MQVYQCKRSGLVIDLDRITSIHSVENTGLRSDAARYKMYAVGGPLDGYLLDAEAVAEIIGVWAKPEPSIEEITEQMLLKGHPKQED